MDRLGPIPDLRLPRVHVAELGQVDRAVEVPGGVEGPASGVGHPAHPAFGVSQFHVGRHLQILQHNGSKVRIRCGSGPVWVQGFRPARPPLPLPPVVRHGRSVTASAAASAMIADPRWQGQDEG